MPPRPSCTAFRAPPSLFCQATTSRSPILPFLLPFTAFRLASQKTKAQGAPKKKKENKYFRREDIRKAKTFALCDAIRYIRAFEVGRNPTSSKYELAVSLRTIKNGPVVRNRIRLPHAVDTSQKIAVFCAPTSAAAEAAKRAGAVLIGEDNIIDTAKDGKIEFDKLLCHKDSLDKLNKAGLGRVLGPKGLMPTTRTGTVVADMEKAITELTGASEYREKEGVIRLAIGQLGFTPEMVAANIQLLMKTVRRETEKFQDKLAKDIHEVVLSSTNGPGFSLNGNFRSEDSLPTKDLSTA